MRWKGKGKFKEAITEDGYHLKVECIEESKYWWVVYKNGEILCNATTKNEYGKNIQIAKSIAIRYMVRHLKKVQTF